MMLIILKNLLWFWNSNSKWFFWKNSQIIKIKFWLCLKGRSLENKAKSYIREDKDVYFLYKCLINLPFIDPEYVEDLFN